MLKLKFGIKRAYGRNRGKISSYHRGGGKKKLYYIIDFNKNLFNMIGKVKSIKFDLYRTSKIAGIAYTNGIFSYILAAEGMKVGNFIYNTDKLMNFYTIGNTCQVQHVKIGDKLYNLEYYPNSGGKIARSAGTFLKVIKKYFKTVLIKLQSGEFRIFFNKCLCTIGRVSNIFHNQIIIGKAGNKRLLGFRPVVRGRAMNPVDHPHGGRTNGGIVPSTPWGKLTRGVKTVHVYSKQIIKKRKK